MNVFALLYTASLLASIAEGFFLLLPLYVRQIGGNELHVGWILWAGAIGSVLLVGSMSRLLDLLKPAMIAAVGCAAYAAGAAVFAFSGHIGWYTYVAGFLQGAGVGLCVASYPMVITGLVDDGKRSVHFSVLAAFGIAGMGISPALGGFLVRSGVGYNQIFLASAIMCLICIALFVSVSQAAAGNGRATEARERRGALRAVIGSEAAFPLTMVFLGACMFSSMMNFQTTFAASRGLDFQIFYLCYIAATLVSRFTLSHFVNRANPRTMTVFLLAVMCGSLAAFSFVGSSALLYGVISALLGSSYGLVYPLIQAQAVNLTIPELREKVLAYFSFSYFVAVFGFPLVSGWVIVRFGYDAFAFVLLAVGIAELCVGIAHLRIKEVRQAALRIPAMQSRLGLSS